MRKGIPSGLAVGSGNALGYNPYNYPLLGANVGVPEAGSGMYFIGFFGTTFPLRWTAAATSGASKPYFVFNVNDIRPGCSGGK